MSTAREHQYQDGDLVWFTESMRMCRYIGPCAEHGYEGLHRLIRLDTGKHLLATLDGIEPVRPAPQEGEHGTD